MKTKGIAVTTIITVMLGVVVLLFVGYWLVRTFTATPALSIEECRSQYMNWCKNCGLRGWTGTETWNNGLVACLGRYAATFGFTVPLGPNGDCVNAVNQGNCNVIGVGT